jgi:predicted secreted protein
MELGIKFLGVGGDWVHLVCQLLFDLLYQSLMIADECGMRISNGNWSILRKPAPVPLLPLQILHDLTWDWTRASMVGSQRLTAWYMAWPMYYQVLHIWPVFQILKEGLRNYVRTNRISKFSVKGMKKSSKWKRTKITTLLTLVCSLYYMICVLKWHTLNKLIKRTHLIGFFVEKRHHSTQCSSSWLHMFYSKTKVLYLNSVHRSQQRLHFFVFAIWLTI